MGRRPIFNDVWTSKTNLPVGGAGLGGDYFDGSIYLLSPGYLFHRYDITTDVWTALTNSPSSRTFLSDCTAVHNAFFYAIGGWPNGDPDIPKMERYDIHTDLWMSLPSSPVDMYAASSAMFPSGVFFHIQGGGAGLIMTFDTRKFAASLTGDPLLTTFMGVQHRLSLRPGIFNLVTTASLVVNALVQTLHALPAEENTVVQMVGIVARLSSSILLVRCHIFDQHIRCDASVPHEHADSDVVRVANTLLLKSADQNSFVLQLPTMTINVTGSLAVVREDGVALAPFLDISLYNSAHESMSGLLPDLDSIGVDAVRERLSQGWYESEDSVTNTDIASALPFLAAHQQV